MKVKSFRASRVISYPELDFFLSALLFHGQPTLIKAYLIKVRPRTVGFVSWFNSRVKYINVTRLGQ